MKKTAFFNLKLKQVSDSIKRKTVIPVSKLGQRIKNVRETLGMTQSQLAKRVGVDQSLISRIEETAESSSFKTVSKVLKALNCDLMMVIVSGTSLEETLKRQAEKVARRIVDRAFSNMAMEEQSPDNRDYKIQYARVMNDLTANPDAALWEE